MFHHKKNAGILALVLLTIASFAQAQVIEEKPPEMEGIDIVEHLGEKIPLNLEFLNEKGDSCLLYTSPSPRDPE